MGSGAPGEDTGYQHLALDRCMAGWHRAGPLRGLLLNPVTLRDESRRWEDDAAGGGGGARQQGSRSHFVMETWPHASKTELNAAQDITRTFGYPAGARAGAAPDQLGVEAVALYATCTGRNVSLDAAGGCPRSPSADVSALRKRSARRGASLQRLMTGSPPFRLAYWSCRARLGVLGSGRTCGRPCPRSRPRSQTTHPLGFGAERRAAKTSEV